MVVVTVGCATEPATESKVATCESDAEPIAIPRERAIHVACASPDAVLDATGNFDRFGYYFGATRDVSTDGSAWHLTAGLALPDGGNWRDELGSATFAGYEEHVGSLLWLGTAGDSRPVRVELALARNPQTALQCAGVDVGTDAYPLTCHVGDATGGARGLCEPFAFPGGGVIAPGRQFMVSFLAQPDPAHVEATLAQIRAIGGVAEVTELSTGSLYAYRVTFGEQTSFDDRRAAITSMLCPLATDLRVDYDAPIGGGFDRTE